MITRQEALVKTLKNIETKYAIQLKDLDDKINAAASQGQFILRVDGVLEDEIQIYLIDKLDYRLIASYKEVKSGREESISQTIISWEQTRIV